MRGAAVGLARPARRKVFVSDTFSRADSASPLGVTDSGQTWSAVSGTWGVSTGKGYCSAVVTNNYGRATLPKVGIAEGVVSCDITLSATSGRACCGVIFRYLNTTNHLMVFLYKTAASALDQVNIQEAAGGAPSILAASAAMGFVNGQTYAVRIDMRGTTVRVCVDGVLAVTATVSAASSVNSGVGFVNFSQASDYDNGGSRWDNLLVTS